MLRPPDRRILAVAAAEKVMTTLERLGILAVLLLVIAVAGSAIYDRLTDRPVGSESTLATPAPAIRKAPTAKVAIKAPVTAYQGKTKAKLKLPDAVQKDDRQQVIAASQVKADPRPQTISTVVNTETGEVQQFVKTDPYPWFAIEARGMVGIAHGFKFKAALPAAERVTRLQVAYDVVRVKALTVGIAGTVDTDRDAFVGVGVKYQW
jgi:hypothetical protein